MKSLYDRMGGTYSEIDDYYSPTLNYLLENLPSAFGLTGISAGSGRIGGRCAWSFGSTVS